MEDNELTTMMMMMVMMMVTMVVVMMMRRARWQISRLFNGIQCNAMRRGASQCNSMQNKAPQCNASQSTADSMHHRSAAPRVRRMLHVGCNAMHRITMCI